MHPHQDPQRLGYWHDGRWSEPPRRDPSSSSGAVLGLLVVLVVLLLINLGLTLYVFGVVHHVVQQVGQLGG